jgi:hypothetical protein
MANSQQGLFRVEALRTRREMHIIGDPLEIRPVSIVSVAVVVAILIVLIIGLLLFVKTSFRFAEMRSAAGGLNIVMSLLALTW